MATKMPRAVAMPVRLCDKEKDTGKNVAKCFEYLFVRGAPDGIMNCACVYGLRGAVSGVFLVHKNDASDGLAAINAAVNTDRIHEQVVACVETQSQWSAFTAAVKSETEAAKPQANQVKVLADATEELSTQQLLKNHPDDSIKKQFSQDKYDKSKKIVDDAKANADKAARTLAAAPAHLRKAAIEALGGNMGSVLAWACQAAAVQPQAKAMLDCFPKETAVYFAQEALLWDFDAVAKKGAVADVDSLKPKIQCFNGASKKS